MVNLPCLKIRIHEKTSLLVQLFSCAFFGASFAQNVVSGTITDENPNDIESISVQRPDLQMTKLWWAKQ